MGNSESSTTSDPVAWLQKLSLGQAQDFEPYTIFPLCVEEVPGEDSGLLLTHQAIEAQLLEILEKGEGEVQELEALNKGDRPVVVLEGDTLVGCKQNRVVARSVILGKGQKTPIPVGCMEQGRWAWKSGRFKAGSMRIKHSVRSASIREVRESKKHRMAKASLDQGRLWNAVACSLQDEQVSSGTSDYNALLEERGEEVRRRSRLERQPGQVGVLVMSGGAFIGLEVAGHPRTWDELADRTLPALLMDRDWAPEGAAGRKGERANATAWLSRIQSSKIVLTPALGQGEEIEVEGDGEDGRFIGSGLWHDQHVVHMAVFAQ